MPLSGVVYTQSALQQAVDNFAGTQVLRNFVVAVHVRDVADGRALASYRSEMSVIPASTQKLITTAVAMDVLGADHRFRTRLVAAGPIEGGVLRGNLYIVGGGDPSLGSPYLEGVARAPQVIANWVAAINAHGITRIDGAVVGDGSYYGTDGAGSGWPWADLGNYYGAGSYGLNLNENSYTLYLNQRQQVGRTPPVLSTDPSVPGLTFTNELVSGPRGSGDQAYIYGAPFNYAAFIRGSIPVGTGRFSIRGSIPDPALFTAQWLDRALEAAGIATVQSPTTDREVGVAPTTGKELHLDTSPPLAVLIDRTNLTSNNLYAEALLRELNKAAGSSELSSTAVIVDWLQARKIDTEGLQLQDGSGLSPRNFFSPQLLTALLRDRAGQTRWRASIPLAGRTGSLQNVLRGTPAEGRVWGKSGTVDGVRAYAGYVDRPDGRRLAYSIVVNNHTVPGGELNRLIYGLMGSLVTVGL